MGAACTVTATAAFLGDRWIASSAFQKAIRRGDEEIAHQAARALLKLDRAMLWRRLACTAVEDIAPVDVELIASALTANSKTDLPTLVTQLCEAPKERSGDYLLSIIQHAPDLEGIRSKWACDLTEADYPHESIAGPDIEVRSLLAWHRGGTDVVRGENLPLRRGDPLKVFQTFRQQGVPAVLVDACGIALRKLRNPLPLIYPALWQSVSSAKRVWTKNAPSGVPTTISGIPLYALGGHTRLGLRAISRWVDDGRKLSLTLARLGVPTKCWRKAVTLALFHVESAVVRPSFHWDARERPEGSINLDQDPSLDDPGQWDVGSYLRERAIKADFTAIGFPVTAISAFLETVAENLPQLDRIRTAVIEREALAQQSGRQSSWKF